jgi:hypothetical protein
MRLVAQKGDLQVLGARTWEGLNLKVDPRTKKLVAAGPIIVATAVLPRFGQLVPCSAVTNRRNAGKPPGKENG